MTKTSAVAKPIQTKKYKLRELYLHKEPTMRKTKKK